MIWDLYENKLNAYGDTKRDRQLEQAREDFYREARGNPAYTKALRNGIEEEFLITRSDKTERFKITAFPGNSLNIGDYIEVWGEVFIVYQTRVQDTLNVTGVLWLCNHLFRWQNFSSKIIERWGVLDSGVYSTTIRGEDDLKYTNKQYKLIFPFDEDTKKLFIDKRIAVDTMYNRDGKEILNVYQITGYDATSESFGEGAHILYLNLRSDEYDDEKDSVKEKICDYIEPEPNTPQEPGLDCKISGSNTIRLGSTRKFVAEFYSSVGEKVEGVVPIWNCYDLPTGVTYKVNDSGVLYITVESIPELANKKFSISLTDDAGIYITDNIVVEIICL